MAHPEVQRKVQDEIDRVLGDNCPTLGQRKNMPYTQVNSLLNKTTDLTAYIYIRPQSTKYCGMLILLLLTTVVLLRM